MSNSIRSNKSVNVEEYILYYIDIILLLYANKYCTRERYNLVACKFSLFLLDNNF